MANSTDPFAESIHGLNPQNLIEKILRNRIYDSIYWKEECFGLTCETLVDKAIKLEYIGGTFGGNQRPSPFICLLLKMLQLQPEREIVLEFIHNEDYKYLTALGLLYLRLTAKPEDIFRTLEPLYKDYRKLRLRKTIDWEIIHMDTMVDDLLSQEYFCDVALPTMPNRIKLEEQKILSPRKSVLDQDLSGDNSFEDSSDSDD